MKLRNLLLATSVLLASSMGASAAEKIAVIMGNIPAANQFWAKVEQGALDKGKELGVDVTVLGSPGGSVIIQFVVKTIVGMLDWGLDPQQAVSMVDFGAANSPKTNVGGEHPDIDTSDNGDHDPLVQGLRKLGHQVDLADQSSGLGAITRSDTGWLGGADPRREGVVLGDADTRSG